MLLPLTAPYLLYYDLCLLLPAVLMLMSDRWPDSIMGSCKAIGIIIWSCISLYMIAFVTVSPHWLQPISLQSVLLVVWVFWLSITVDLTGESQAPGFCA